MIPTNGYCPICRVPIARGLCAQHPDEQLVAPEKWRAQQQQDQASEGYPFFLYIYDTDGKRGDPVDIPTALGLRILFQATVKPAVDEGREVVITDCDDCCVFHAKGGRVIFPEAQS